jgi:hypothetical protein
MEINLIFHLFGLEVKRMILYFKINQDYMLINKLSFMVDILRILTVFIGYKEMPIYPKAHMV